MADTQSKSNPNGINETEEKACFLLLEVHKLLKDKRDELVRQFLDLGKRKYGT